MRVYEAFCGIGGFSLGFQRAGFEIVGGCEIDPYARAVYRKNFGIEPDGDIRAIESVSADIICGGFPCQPFSVAGQRKQKEDERHLWPEMLRVVEASKPEWVVGENVHGIWPHIDSICQDLEDVGFQTLPICLSARAFGAAHLRRRIFFIANSKRNQLQRGETNAAERPEFGGEEQLSRLLFPRVRDALSAARVWRADHGVSSRVDIHRNKAIGNAIVPQIAEWIAERIKEVEAAGDLI